MNLSEIYSFSSTGAGEGKFYSAGRELLKRGAKDRVVQWAGGGKCPKVAFLSETKFGKEDLYCNV